MALISKFVPTPDAGRLAVRSLVEAGVDFLKIHNGLSRETYLAVTEEAKRRNIPFAGHVPSDVTITEASEVGQRSIEHLAPLTAVCVDAGALRGVEKNPDQPIAINQSKCREALRQLARNRTFLSPTLVSGAPRSADNVTETESRLHYIRAPKRAAWPRLSSELRPGAQVRHDLNLRLTRMASDAQVRLLPTTDTGGANRIPGWATLEELTLFTEAGLSPLESLRSATLNAAAYFNMTDSLGSIATGKLADLVMLDANPLADIRNLYRIAAVIANGRLFGSAARQKLLDDVAEAAR
jgi:imidazolonepropionase-like amidohydrolase